MWHKSGMTFDPGSSRRRFVNPILFRSIAGRWGMATVTRLFVGLLGSGLIAAGCGTATFVVQQYDGEPLDRSRIAMLRVNGDAPVRLEELDGEVLAYELHDSGSRVHIEMLPGEHELGLSDGLGLPLKRRRFVAHPGKIYRPMVFHTGSNGPDAPSSTWVVAIYEVDPDSDRIIREISQVPVPQDVVETSPSPNHTAAHTPEEPAGTLVPPAASTATEGEALPTHVTSGGLPDTTAPNGAMVKLPQPAALPGAAPEPNPAPSEANPL